MWYVYLYIIPFFVSCVNLLHCLEIEVLAGALRSSLLPQILLAISGHGANWILNVLDYNRAHVEIPVTFT